ncbi:cytochrome b5-like heme/steroid binding domain-containing protein [Alternaria alternata]|nr:cytochrome b5-like heme/steroid binding domain-containing protein [Alternaria alternata]
MNTGRCEVSVEVKDSPRMLGSLARLINLGIPPLHTPRHPRPSRNPSYFPGPADQLFRLPNTTNRPPRLDAIADATFFPPFQTPTNLSRRCASTKLTMSESLTTKQVAEHNTVEKGLYIIVDGDVYKMDSFVDEHPGGAKILKRVGGKDASKQFWKYHNESVLKKYAPKLKIGTVKEESKL